MAGTASGISLPQLAAALGLTVPVQGMVHASKFTFRGDPRDFLNATASIWTELTGFSWRERNADVIMLGANFYGHTVQLQQLFIKQRRNELTLSGETAIGTEWLNPDFRGDISASINDLGQFAELFGASPDAFAGKVAARGRMHAHERTVDGDLALTGDALKIFRVPVDSLTARIGLESGRAHVDQLELKRGEDFLRAQGKIDLAQKKSFTVSAESWCRELGDYASRIAHHRNVVRRSFCQGYRRRRRKQFQQYGFRTNRSILFFCAKQLAQRCHRREFTQDKTERHREADLKGTIDLTDPKHFRASLSSANELRCNGTSCRQGCGHGLELRKEKAGSPFSEITLDGRVLTLSQPSYRAAPQSVTLCDNGEPGGPAPD